MCSASMHRCVAAPATAARRRNACASRLRRRTNRLTRHPGLDPGPAFPFDGTRKKRVPAQGRDDGLATLTLRQRAQPQRVQPNEPRCVAVVVAAAAFLEGDEVLIVERL